MKKIFDGLVTLKWDSESVEYEHFIDHGHYMLELKNAGVKDIDEALETMALRNDNYSANCCSGTIKKNDKNEVLMSHSMDVEISTCPGFLSRISDGKYDTIIITYAGAGTGYNYDSEGLAALDKDERLLKLAPFQATDVINEAGLYMALDMRCGDEESGMDCPGTNPGKPRAGQLGAPALVGINCGTVKEAIEFLNNSYDWYTFSFKDPDGTPHSWSMAFLIGDATGEYGLVEFGRNGVFFTPYQNFQSNYYIHPLLAERATKNHGHGRAAALLDGLMDVKDEYDIMENQKKARYHIQLRNPSWEYFSDCESLCDINVRRSLSQEEMLKTVDKEIVHVGDCDDVLKRLSAYYEGDEQRLRELNMIWMGTITTGVNCRKKRAMVQMWENDTEFEIQW